MLNYQSTDLNFTARGGLIASPGQWHDAIRTLSASQLYHFQWHLLRLDDGCRRSRFGSPTSDACIRAHGTRVDPANTVILGCFESGHMRGAAELRSLGATWGDTAEIAFSVEPRWQGCGIGTALMAALIEAARERGIARIYITCHTLNRHMQRIAETAGARIDFDGCECVAEIDVVGTPHAGPEHASGPELHS